MTVYDRRPWFRRVVFALVGAGFNPVARATRGASPRDCFRAGKRGWRRAALAAISLVWSACAGGSGSSGFISPLSENMAITMALSENTCVDFEGLTICAASAEPTPPSPSATAAPDLTPESSPTSTPTPPPDATGAPAAATETPSPSATPDPNPPASVHIAVARESTSCVSADRCNLVLSFTAAGFPPDTSFRVAIRAGDPLSLWSLAPEPQGTGLDGDPSFDVLAPLALDGDPLAAPGSVEVAILAFDGAAPELPLSVVELIETGAQFAFVSDRVEISLPPQ